VACCALPLLLAAGALSGVGWAITGRWLPAVAGLLIASAGVLWWLLLSAAMRRPCPPTA
jgi:mercuric ion transport protein